MNSNAERLAYECIGQMSRGEADQMRWFGRPFGSEGVGPERMKRIAVVRERSLPVFTPEKCGSGVADLEERCTFKSLNCPTDTFLGQVVRARCLSEIRKKFVVETVCETAFAAVFKEMPSTKDGYCFVAAWLGSARVGNRHTRPCVRCPASRRPRHS